MLEAIVAGVIAHGIYHKTMSIEHSADETTHVQVSDNRTIQPIQQNNNIVWQFEVCTPEARPCSQ
jgi:hypothetical protein